MKLLTMVALRNVSMSVALAASALALLPAQAKAGTDSSVSTAIERAAANERAPLVVASLDAPHAAKGLLASGQIHQRSTPAIVLGDEPALPFYFKSWLFALLTVLIVVAVKRPWNTATVKSLARRSIRVRAIAAPLVRN